VCRLLSPSNTILYLFSSAYSRIPDDPGAPRVAYSLRLTLFFIYFPQPSRIPDDPGAPHVAYSLRLTLFYIFFLSLAGFQMILVRHMLPTLSV
jgi:hypothetical protein